MINISYFQPGRGGALSLWEYGREKFTYTTLKGRNYVSVGAVTPVVSHFSSRRREKRVKFLMANIARKKKQQSYNLLGLTFPSRC
jgi:hypothetical protein